MDYDLIRHFEAMAVLIIAIVVIFLLLDRWRQARLPRGYVYFIRDPATGEVKIGMTRRKPSARLAELTKGPRELELLHSVSTPEPWRLERELHRRYADKRGRGEWFALSAADLRAIRRL